MMAPEKMWIYENSDMREKFAMASRNFAEKNFDQKELTAYIIKDRKRLMEVGDDK